MSSNLNQIKIVIRDQDLLEKWLSFKEIIKARIEIDKTTIKKSMNDYYQELLRESLDNFFADNHKVLINKTIKDTVKKVFKDEMKWFINDLKEINIASKFETEYLKQICNVIFKMNVESMYKSDDRDFFDEDSNVHKEYLEIPISMEKHANDLEKMKQIAIHNFKKNK